MSIHDKYHLIIEKGILNPMKKMYGKIFKELRLNKGYSIKEISSSEISNATISKFEHGVSMISIDKFFRILSNINVSPEEFFLYAEQRLKITYSSFTSNFSVFREKNSSIEKLQKETIFLEEQLNASPEQNFRRIQTLNLKATILQVLPAYSKNITPQDLQIIKQHLLEIKSWTEVELRIYCGTIHLFDIDVIKKLTYKLVNPLSYHLITPDMKWLMVIAIINVIEAILPGSKSSSREAEFFKEIIQYLRENPIPDRYMLEKGVCKFNIGCFESLAGNKIKGEQSMREAIDAFLLIDCDDLARDLIFRFENITGSKYHKL